MVTHPFIVFNDANIDDAVAGAIKANLEIQDKLVFVQIEFMSKKKFMMSSVQNLLMLFLK